MGKKFKESKIGSVLSDKQRRTYAIMCVTLILNAAYTAYNGVLGVMHSSYWFLTMTAYYAILAVMELFILGYKWRVRGEEAERIATRFTGIMLIALSIVLCGMSYLGAFHDSAERYGTIVMITIAAYTFWKLSTAIVNFVKAGKRASLSIRAFRAITCANAVVAIYSLQRSMLVSFEGMDSADILIMNMVTGAAVYFIVLALGISLILKSRREGGENKNESHI